MEAVAKHDFRTTPGTDELPFRQGDSLVILNYGAPNTTSGWFFAINKEGQKGLVPCNYIEIDKPEWFQGQISRIAAERKLESNPVDGAFLVRMSESSPGEFSLSVKCIDSVQHFRILKKDDRFLLWNTSFASISKLVDHYRNETVSRTSQIFLRDMQPDHTFLAEALYDFQTDDQENSEEEAQELGFRKGELITVFDDSDENWWGGMIGERRGFFPKTYVRRYVPSVPNGE